MKVRDDTLYAYYDLDSAPINFGILKFLVSAEIARQQNGLSRIHFVVAWGREGKFNRNSAKLKVMDHDQLTWRVQNLLLPACELLPSIRSVVVFDDREDLSEHFEAVFENGGMSFPFEYHPLALTDDEVSVIFDNKTLSMKYIIQCFNAEPSLNVRPFKAPQAALTVVRSVLEGLNASPHNLITVTLRQSEFDTARNSEIDEWTKFSGYLKEQGYFPVLIPDTEYVLKGLSRDAFAPLLVGAALNLPFRMALYNLSMMNYFVNNGPAALCKFSQDTPYLVYKVMVEDANSLGSAAQLASSTGWTQSGENLPFAGDNQRMIWQPDRYEHLKAGFEDFVLG